MNQFISSSPRHKIEKIDDAVRITINSQRNLGIVLFMILWFFLWIYMFSGVSIVWWSMFLVATGIANPSYHASPFLFFVLLFVFIWLLALFFLGMFGIYKLLWEVFGKEVIEVYREKMIVVRQIFGWKRTKEFLADKRDKFIIRNTSQSLFWNPLRKRYSNAFELNYDRKTYRFGYLAKEQEAKEIFSVIQEFIVPIRD